MLGGVKKREAGRAPRAEEWKTENLSWENEDVAPSSQDVPYCLAVFAYNLKFINY